MALEIINNFAGADDAICNSFFQLFYLGLLQDIFFVLTDTDHKSGMSLTNPPEYVRGLKSDNSYFLGFKLQSVVLARMFQLVETNKITAPLFDPTTVPDPTVTNPQFLRAFTANLLKSAFPHLQP